MDDARTVFCGNLSERVTEELLYELFLQAAPLERVKIPTDREGRKSNFAFITFKHEVSVEYALQLLNGTPLFEKNINVKPRNTTQVRSADKASPKVDIMAAKELFVNHLKAGQCQLQYDGSSNTPNRYGHRDFNNYRNVEERPRDNQYKHRDYNRQPNNNFNSANRQRRNPYDRPYDDRNRRHHRY